MPNNKNNPTVPSTTKNTATPSTVPTTPAEPIVPNTGAVTLESEVNKVLNKTKAKKPQPKDKLATKSAMLHTYKQDVEGLVRKRKVSLVNVMAMQSDKKMATDGSHIVNTMGTAKKKEGTTKFMIMASVLMLVLGAVALFVAYSAYQAQLQSTEQDKSQVLADDTMIFVEHRARLNVTDRLPRETLSELAKILSQSQATLGSVTQVILEWSAWSDTLGAQTTFTISQEQLIQLLGLTLPEQFIRLLGNPSDYMIGMHMADRNSPFIILTTVSYEHAFAGMLEWEGNAEAQLSPLFNTNGSGSSKRNIEDIVVQNIDARAVRDDARNLKLLYAFLDHETLLITNNIHTLTEVARRYKVRSASGTADVSVDFIR